MMHRPYRHIEEVSAGKKYFAPTMELLNLHVSCEGLSSTFYYVVDPAAQLEFRYAVIIELGGEAFFATFTAIEAGVA